MLRVDFTARRDEFQLEVRAELLPKVVAVFGRSGAGKTTLLHCVAGLVRPRRGRIALDDVALFDSDIGVNVPVHRRGVGLVFQDGRLFPHYSVAGNLRYGRAARTKQSPPVDFDGVVDLLELRPLLDRRPSRLSGGERQRVALGRALLAAPRLLLLDEPLASLDDSLKRQIIPLLQRIRDRLDIPVLHVSHDLSEILQITEHLLVLERGQVLGCGRYVDLVQEGAVFEAIAGTGLINVITVAEADGAAGGRGGKRAVVRSAPLAGAAVATAEVLLRLPPAADAFPGPLSLAIGVHDVALAPEPLDRVSIQNQIKGRVCRTVDHDGRVLVEVDIGQPLLVLITPQAATALCLREHQEIICLIKTSAIRVLGNAPKPSAGRPCK